MSNPTLQGEKQAILDAVAQGEDQHWQIGTHYNTIVEHDLATQAGFKTAAAFFASELKELPQSTLSLYGSVAKSFSEPVAKKYGCNKLALLVTYEGAVHLSPGPGDPAQVLVGVPQKDGTVAQKAFQSCTVADLHEALKHLKAPVQLPSADSTRVQQLQQALDAALGAGKVEVKAHLRGRKTAIQLSSFDLDQAATVADALKHS